MTVADIRGICMWHTLHAVHSNSKQDRTVKSYYIKQVWAMFLLFGCFIKVDIHVYMYVYIYVYIHIYVAIWIYLGCQDRHRCSASVISPLATTRTCQVAKVCFALILVCWNMLGTQVIPWFIMMFPFKASIWGRFGPISCWWFLMSQ